ncbi:TonB family protein [Mucilaginibacter sp. UYP25]|uniref:energy transducer TonB n=1 Tax=unclassified Mucilaginibacter TaxID=2617802 RepID=UPI00339A16B1
MKTYCLFTFLLFAPILLFAQIKRPSASNDLPQNVINEFSKAVNYAWNYANNTDAFKGALMLRLRQRGVYSQFDIKRTIQDVGKSKNCRNLVLGALADYTGMSRLNQTLLNMSIPANIARTLTSYAYSLQQQDASNNASTAPADKSGNKYIVIAQKTYFYSFNAKGGVGQRRPAYLVEGEEFEGLKEFEGYIYSDFTNPTTKKTTKGWILKMDIEKLDDQPEETQINNIDANSPFNSLKKYDGEHQDVKKVFADPVVAGILKTILGTDYVNFNKDFLSSPLRGDVYVRHNVLYIKSFVTHYASTNASFFIDLKSGKSFMYWNTFNKDYQDLLKTYGEVPLTSAIVNFIQRYKTDMQNFIIDYDMRLLDEILNYHDPNEIVNIADTDQRPEFPNGEVAFINFLRKNVKYPDLAKKNEIQGRVTVEFVCEKDGSLTNFHIIKGIGGGCDEELVRILKLSPRWKPGIKDAKEVRTLFIMPFYYTL